VSKFHFEINDCHEREREKRERDVAEGQVTGRDREEERRVMERDIKT
jgi:hypothetical protein